MINNIILIAKEAGEIVRSGFKGELNIEFKGSDINLVTQIDKASEKCIKEYVLKSYPEHGILGEEGTDHNPSAEYKWVIDPLDGTSNFAHGLPIFAVSIGVVKNEVPVAGVIYDVMRDVVFSAEKGSGAYENEKKISVTNNSILQHGMLVTGFPYNISENPNNAFERFFVLTKSARAVRRLGSAALDLAYVANGIFDAFWEINLHPWDVAAGMLLVEEAGGKVTDFTGNTISIYDKEILASNNAIHVAMMDKLLIKEGFIKI